MCRFKFNLHRYTEAAVSAFTYAARKDLCDTPCKITTVGRCRLNSTSHTSSSSDWLKDLPLNEKAE
jgi:hypothetical protein